MCHRLFTTILGACIVLINVQSSYSQTNEQTNISVKNVTVLIHSSEAQGSGVIINRNNNLYTVLTARHVVEIVTDINVFTSDNNRYLVDKDSVRYLPNSDLALIQFTSNNIYKVARIGDSSKISEGSSVSVAGIPNEVFLNGRTTFFTGTGEVIIKTKESLGDGYGICTDLISLPGMSGGPIFNSKKEIVGINGFSAPVEAFPNVDSKNTPSFFRTGLSYAIPINILRKFVPQIIDSSVFKLPQNLPNFLTKNKDYFVTGLIKQNKSDFQGTVKDFTEYLQTNPNSGLSYLFRGNAHLALNEKIKAIEDYNNAINLIPKEPLLYKNRGAVKALIGDNLGAIKDFNQAISLNPDDYSAYSNRGLTYSALGDIESAIKDFDKGLQINPYNAVIYDNYGQVLLKAGKIQEALEKYNQAIKVNPNLFATFKHRAAARLNLGDKSGALEDLKQAAALAQAQNNQSIFNTIQSEIKSLNP